MILAKHLALTSQQAPLSADWRQLWRDSFTLLPDLLAFLQLSSDDFSHPVLEKPDFSLRVPRSFAARMQKRNPRDPLLLQVLPQMVELIRVANFTSDPVADLQFSPSPGLIHKYASRALLITTGACAINCRYCFRRSYPYADAQISSATLSAALAYLARTPGINEVILSGGDPLALSNDKLFALIAAILQTPSIKRIRLHTRTPIVLPARVDPEFLKKLAAIPVPVVMVLHSNHAQEWQDTELLEKMRALRSLGVTLLNQAVLLADINDTAAAQIDLSEALFAAGVMPYYLNLLDRVAGAAHFEVPDAQASKIYAEMQAHLPGFLLPKLVRDVPGQASKSVLAQASLAG
jgi:L-lysine 2,3-aminomutase